MSDQGDKHEEEVKPSWFIQSKFARFWYHYNTMMMSAHRDAVIRAKYRASIRKASLMKMLLQAKGIRAVPNMPQSSLCSSSLSIRTSSERSRARKNKKKRKRKKRNRRLREMAQMASESNQEVSDTESLYSKMKSGMKINDLKDEEDDIEFNEEMLEFMERSRKHREEWNLRKSSLKNPNQTVFLTSTSMQDAIAQEHPDAIRSREMQQLYGSAASRIHAMETAVQLSFDRISTLHRPKYWPNIPLHVMF